MNVGIAPNHSCQWWEDKIRTALDNQFAPPYHLIAPHTPQTHAPTYPTQIRAVGVPTTCGHAHPGLCQACPVVHFTLPHPSFPLVPLNRRGIVTHSNPRPPVTTLPRTAQTSMHPSLAQNRISVLESLPTRDQSDFCRVNLIC